MNLKEIRDRLKATRDGLRHLAGLDSLDDTQAVEFDWLEAEDRYLTGLESEAVAAEKRAAERETRRSEIRNRIESGSVGFEGQDDGIGTKTVNTIVKRDGFEILESRGATADELRDAACRVLESRVDSDNMPHVERVLKRHLNHRSGPVTRDWARKLVGRAHPTYERAFEKYLSNPMNPLWTPEEARAIAVGTNTQGGFLLPTHLDPTVILTNTGSNNIMRQLARVVTLTEGTTWNGVSSAGVSASFDAELAEVSDDSPSFANPSIPVYTARAFVGASIEAFQDVSGLSGEAMMLFADARDRLEGAKYVKGAGSTEPTGIFTALDANTNVELTSTTAATIGVVDLHTTYRSVGQRWRGRGSWLMNPLYSTAIKALGTAVSASYSGDLREPTAGRILGRPVYESDDAPATQTTTTKDNEIVFGDFSNFVIVDKPGSTSVEYIPHLFGTTNGLPIGQRGWFAFWRTGSDSVNDSAFRLLQDKTSA